MIVTAAQHPSACGQRAVRSVLVVRLASGFALQRRVWNIVAALIVMIVIVSTSHIGLARLALLIGISVVVIGAVLSALGLIVRGIRGAAPATASEPGATR